MTAAVARCAGDCANYSLSWWVLGPLLGVLSVAVIVGILATCMEMNPDPGWRARQAEILRLQQEAQLRRLREESPGMHRA